MFLITHTHRGSICKKRGVNLRVELKLILPLHQSSLVFGFMLDTVLLFLLGLSRCKFKVLVQLIATKGRSGETCTALMKFAIKYGRNNCIVHIPDKISDALA